jgi:hypothetical protein
LVGWVERKTSRKNKVVLQGEFRGKISSPHSINLVGTKRIPKWKGMLYIGSLYGKNWRNQLAGSF